MAGDLARGIFAQSVGGGGGVGGVGLGGEVSDDGKAPGQSATLGLGASGGHGGAAGKVTVSNAGGIATAAGPGGADSQQYAILAQSVGGGGGPAP